MKDLLRHQSSKALLSLTLLVPISFSLSALAQEPGSRNSRRTEPLIEKVQAATRQFKDLKVALEQGWVPATPCVSGPEAGAMGVHFVLSPQSGQPDRNHDGAVNATEPEFLIYEPMLNGAMRLVGVEFSLSPANGHPATRRAVRPPSMEIC